MSTATLSTVVKAFRVLELFRHSPELGVSECARAMRIPRPSAHRLLSTLATTGALERTPAGRYQLGLRLFEIGALAPYRCVLYDGACAPLEKVVDLSGLPAHLAVVDHDQVLYLVKAHRTPHDRARTRAGTRQPLHATGLGKALLAFCGEELVDRVVAMGLRRYTQYTITTERRLREELADARGGRIAYDRQEMRLGLVSAAVPVRGGDGDVVAAISVAGPSERYARRLESFGPMLQRAAEAIERNVADRLSAVAHAQAS